MLEKPKLAEAVIIAALQAFEFLPIGSDAQAWVYRVKAFDSQRAHH